MTPQLQALTLAFVLMLIYLVVVIVKEDRAWRKEFKKDETVDDGQLLSSENVAQ